MLEHTHPPTSPDVLVLIDFEIFGQVSRVISLGRALIQLSGLEKLHTRSFLIVPFFGTFQNLERKTTILCVNSNLFNLI